MQFKFESSFLGIYYCSKSHSRCWNKFSWLNRVLWNWYFVMKLLFAWNTFSEPLLLKDLYFLKAVIYVFGRATFPDDTVFRIANFRLLTLLLQLHFLFIVINPINIGVFRLKLPVGAQSGCATRKIFLLIPWANILHHFCFRRVALKGTIYQKM